jgi:hypothetical protein
VSYEKKKIKKIKRFYNKKFKEIKAYRIKNILIFFIIYRLFLILVKIIFISKSNHQRCKNHKIIIKNYNKTINVKQVLIQKENT